MKKLYYIPLGIIFLFLLTACANGEGTLPLPQEYETPMATPYPASTPIPISMPTHMALPTPPPTPIPTMPPTIERRPYYTNTPTLSLLVDIDQVIRTIPTQAHQMGADALIFFTIELRDYPHWSYSPKQRHIINILREESEKISLNFIADFIPPYAIGCGSDAAYYFGNALSRLFNEHGNNIAVIGGGWHLAVDAIHRGAIYIGTNEYSLSPFEIYENSLGQLVTWPVPPRSLFEHTIVEYGNMRADVTKYERTYLLQQIIVDYIALYTGKQNWGVTIAPNGYDTYLIFVDFMIF